MAKALASSVSRFRSSVGHSIAMSRPSRANTPRASAWARVPLTVSKAAKLYSVMPVLVPAHSEAHPRSDGITSREMPGYTSASQVGST
jgi:hypothetical protein